MSSAEAERRLGALLAKARSMQVCLGGESSRLEGARRLLGHRRSIAGWPPWLPAAILAVTLALIAWPAIELLPLGWSAQDACSVYMPDQLVRALRPPEDCSMCRGLTKVEKVANISPEEFEKRYAYTGCPVVIVDAMVNWTAQNEFSFEFFKELYEESSEYSSFQMNCQFFPYETEFQSLQEVFNMSEDRARMKQGTKPWYIGWSNCDEVVARVLRRHYSRPYFLPATAESKRTDWVFMGSPGYGAHMHVDNVDHPSWQAQLRGSKLWKLQPPPECYYDCLSMEITVDRGEIIVVDTNRWYHSTLIVSEDMSITIGAEFD
ncbi:uncharacterized protein LOC124171223 [Ischnura elegans]|uniref:uncharacterized protein LOC124171223 n=1 Tax=Ischnura elegans TaxID=197161 RepID=UPI001ED87EF4|nr:uncharacterized protein LOC124171223 [Ischnura elegans]